MLDVEFIQRKINLIREDLIKLENFKGATFDELSKDWLKWNALEHILMKIIGRGIDINEHIIAKMAKPETTSPRSYKEIFLKLAELKVLPEEFAQEISRSAGFRNAIVHVFHPFFCTASIFFPQERQHLQAGYLKLLLKYPGSLRGQ